MIDTWFLQKSLLFCLHLAVGFHKVASMSPESSLTCFKIVSENTILLFYLVNQFIFLFICRFNQCNEKNQVGPNICWSHQYIFYLLKIDFLKSDMTFIYLHRNNAFDISRKSPKITCQRFLHIILIYWIEF